MKARRYKLRVKALGVVLRRSDFQHDGAEAKLNRPTSSAMEAVPLVKSLFEEVVVPGVKYRATMVVLGRLECDLPACPADTPV